MSLVPMNRETLLSLKAKKDEDARQTRIGQIVNTIYTHTVHVAEVTTRTCYEHQVPLSNVYSRSTDPCPFHMNNMDKILTKLQALFPDAIVTNKRMVMGRDKVLYDIANIKSHHDAVLPFLNIDSSQLYIVIDWGLENANATK